MSAFNDTSNFGASTLRSTAAFAVCFSLSVTSSVTLVAGGLGFHRIRRKQIRALLSFLETLLLKKRPGFPERFFVFWLIRLFNNGLFQPGDRLLQAVLGKKSLCFVKAFLARGGTAEKHDQHDA